MAAHPWAARRLFFNSLLNSIGVGGNAGISRHGWYFLDDNDKKVGCGSGYEALFVAYLKWNAVPFEYQKWLFARTPTASRKFRKAYLKKNPPVMRMGQTVIGPSKRRRVVRMGWRPPGEVAVNIRVSGILYVPDFYLPITDEFVEIKGWPVEPRQVAAVQYPRRKGYRIRVLEWEHLRELLGFPFRSYSTCLNRAQKGGLYPSRTFANPHWVKEQLCARMMCANPLSSDTPIKSTTPFSLVDLGERGVYSSYTTEK